LDTGITPTLEIKVVTRWLNSEFRTRTESRWKVVENAMPHGHQPDGAACGVYTLNAKRAAILGEPIYVAPTPAALRVKYYLEVMRKYIRDVREQVLNSLVRN
jgi:hypothetical protein